jgi:hypothetical protein
MRHWLKEYAAPVAPAAELEPNQSGCHALEDGATGVKIFVFQGAHMVKF